MYHELGARNYDLDEGFAHRRLFGRAPLSRCGSCLNIPLSTGSSIIGCIQILIGLFGIYGLIYLNGKSTLSTIEYTCMAIQLVSGIIGCVTANSLKVGLSQFYFYLNALTMVCVVVTSLLTSFDTCKDYNHYFHSQEQLTCGGSWGLFFLQLFFALYCVRVTFSLYARLEVGDVDSCKSIQSKFASPAQISRGYAGL
mmetsp:Transcript_41240/g.47530  ORF Transcript_41240/g.47530 Transcript_41240/m.47530 type:complete len:197 (-) Transcript_41240:239-829(-)